MSGFVIHCDALCQPYNPHGVTTYGFIVQEDQRDVYTEAAYIGEGEGQTNNTAEYWAVIRALTWSWKQRCFEQAIEIRSDSQLVIRQLRGEWAVKSPSVIPFYERAMRGMHPFTALSLRWVPREENARADALTRQAYSLHLQQHGSQCIAKRG